MTRRRFIADSFSPDSSRPTHATLLGDQAMHLARVLRAQPGQCYDVVTNGFLHRAEIVRVSDRQVDFVLQEEIESEAALPVHLLLAVFKFDHMEWAIEKATELGVARMTPILARRTEKHLALASGKRVERWRRIALEAAKQSRRTTAPEIADPALLPVALQAVESSLSILLSETERERSLTRALAEARSDLAIETNVALAIGPEGGWTGEEMQLFADRRWVSVTLGPRILRAETAAIAALSIVGAHLYG